MLNEILCSVIEISSVNFKSVITSSKIFRPLKVFPLHKGKACQVIFSNYGGGFVEGDHIMAHISCLANTVTAFSSQANTRVYRSENGLTSKQEIFGKLGEKAMAVYIGDPIVPHQGSKFEQKQHWKMAGNAVLLIVDWFEAGRILNKERFAFQSFSTDLKIEMDSVAVVWDKFQIDPTKSNLNSPGAFMDHSSYMNIFLAGNENEERVKILESHLRFLSKKYFQEDKPLEMNKADLIGSAVKINEKAFLIRSSARNNELLQPFVKELSYLISRNELLGFNPLEGRV